LRASFTDRLGQAEVDDFCRCIASLVKVHDDVTWLDIPVNELLLVQRGETSGDLRGNFHSQLHLNFTGAFDEPLKGLSSTNSIA